MRYHRYDLDNVQPITSYRGTDGKDFILKNFIPLYRDCIHEKCTQPLVAKSSETRIKLQLIVEFYISKEDKDREKESQYPHPSGNLFPHSASPLTPLGSGVRGNPLENIRNCFSSSIESFRRV
jgi:hypothetical protein